MTTVFVGMMYDKKDGSHVVYAGLVMRQAVSKTKFYASSNRLTWIEFWEDGLQTGSIEITRNTETIYRVHNGTTNHTQLIDAYDMRRAVFAAMPNATLCTIQREELTDAGANFLIFDGHIGHVITVEEL